MKNKKLIATIASLCLVVVAVVAAVIGVLAAQQQNVRGDFRVSYVANDVSAIVTLAKKAERDGDTWSSTEGSSVSHEFFKREATSTQTLTIANETLTVLTSDMNRYVVYKFTFTNTNTANSMTITPKYTSVASGDKADLNVSVQFAWNTAPTVAYATERAAISGGSAMSSLAAHDVAKTATETLYIIVAITDINADAHYYLGGTGENSLAFALTRTGVSASI